ncbi:hypothetical protein BGZ46_008994 [Entomortierella lignicola]|nr:hypothetical protein BGZ46_008994 [Entomortierella lignicola]
MTSTPFSMSSQSLSQSSQSQNAYSNFGEPRPFALKDWQNHNPLVQPESPLDFKYRTGSRLELNSRTPFSSQTFSDTTAQTRRPDQVLTTAGSAAELANWATVSDQCMLPSKATIPTTSTMGISAIHSTIPSYLRPYISKEPILSTKDNSQDEHPSMSQSKIDANSNSNSGGAFHSLTTTLFSQSRELRFLFDRISSFDTVLNNVQRCFEDYEKRLSEGENKSIESMVSILESKISEKMTLVLEQEGLKLMTTIQDRVKNMQDLQEERLYTRLDTFRQEMDKVGEAKGRAMNMNEDQVHKTIEDFKQEMGTVAKDIQQQVLKAQEDQLGLLFEDILVECKKEISTNSLQDEMKELKTVISQQSQILAIILKQNHSFHSVQAHLLSISHTHRGSRDGCVQQNIPTNTMLATNCNQQDQSEERQANSSHIQKEIELREAPEIVSMTYEHVSSPCMSCVSSLDGNEPTLYDIEAESNSSSPFCGNEAEITCSSAILPPVLTTSLPITSLPTKSKRDHLAPTTSTIRKADLIHADNNGGSVEHTTTTEGGTSGVTQPKPSKKLKRIHAVSSGDSVEHIVVTEGSPSRISQPKSSKKVKRTYKRKTHSPSSSQRQEEVPIIISPIPTIDPYTENSSRSENPDELDVNQRNIDFIGNMPIMTRNKRGLTY